MSRFLIIEHNFYLHLFNATFSMQIRLSSRQMSQAYRSIPYIYIRKAERNMQVTRFKLVATYFRRKALKQHWWAIILQIFSQNRPSWNLWLQNSCILKYSTQNSTDFPWSGYNLKAESKLCVSGPVIQHFKVHQNFFCVLFLVSEHHRLNMTTTF